MLSETAIRILFCLNPQQGVFLRDVYEKMPDGISQDEVKNEISTLCSMGLAEKKQDVFVCISDSGLAVTGFNHSPSPAVVRMLSRMRVEYPVKNPNKVEQEMEYSLPEHSQRLFLDQDESAVLIALGEAETNGEKTVPYNQGAKKLELRGLVQSSKGLSVSLTELGRNELTEDALELGLDLYLPYTEAVAKNRTQRLLVEVAAQTEVGNVKMAKSKDYLQALGNSEWMSNDIKRELHAMTSTGHVYKSGNNMYYINKEWILAFGIKPLGAVMAKRVAALDIFKNEEERNRLMSKLGYTFNEKKSAWVSTTKKTKSAKFKSAVKATKPPKPKKPVKKEPSLNTDESMMALEKAADEQLDAEVQWDDGGSELDTEEMLKESLEFINSLAEKANAEPRRVVNKEQKVTFLKHLAGGLFLGNEPCQAMINSILEDLE